MNHLRQIRILRSTGILLQSSPAADTAEEEESYYIKEVDGVVKVFACQGEEKKLYLITSIPFELLSQTDQNMFSKGVTKKTKAELDEFLENFDS